MRRRGRSERLARSTRQGRSEPRAVQAREMLNRPILVLAPSATLSTEIHTSVPLPNTSFREFFRREALKAVGDPASIQSDCIRCLLEPSYQPNARARGFLAYRPA